MPQPHIQPGSTWITEIDRKPWPCIVFAEDKLPKEFLSLKPRGRPFHFPVLIMGRYKLQWRRNGHLREYEPSEWVSLTDGSPGPADSGRLTPDEKRVEAFKEAYRMPSLQIFEDIVVAKMARAEEEKMRVGRSTLPVPVPGPSTPIRTDTQGHPMTEPVVKRTHQPATRSSSPAIIKREKRYDGDVFTTPTLKRRSNVVDLRSDSEDENDPPSGGIMAANTTSRKKAEMPAPADADDDDEQHIHRLSSRKKRKRTTLTEYIPNIRKNRKTGLSTPPPTQKKPSFRRVGSSKQKSTAEVHADRQQKVNIYINDGSHETTFQANLVMINANPHLSAHLVTPANDDPYVRSSALANMTEQEFAPIAEYLTNGDYTPLLMPGIHPRLQGVNSERQHEDAALAAGALWNRAKDLEMEGLLTLIRRKINHQWPLANDVLLMFTRLIFFETHSEYEAETSMRMMLMEGIRERFYSCMERDGLLLSRVMQGNEEIARFVGQSLVDGSVEGAEDGKEGKEEKDIDS
ncbi:hypothetical protein BDV97DRAFT_400291 [Delphinella strobiligena]|nr:hypothetical protein BDV97DRAFT_400291 [Delphinella strobiligena]